MKSSEDYRNELRPFIPHRAFLKVDRGDSLFVSDAPRRISGFILDVKGYRTCTENGLIFITPLFEDAPESAKKTLIRYLKAANAGKTRIIRQQLALALRTGHIDEIDFWERFMKDTEGSYET